MFINTYLCFHLTDGETTKFKSANLIISESTFSHNSHDGIFLGGEDSGNIEIQSTAIHDSPQNGLLTAFSHVNSLKLLNCAFVRNKIGIKLSSFTGSVNIKNTKVSSSTNNGLYVDTNGEKTIHIENSSVTHSNGYGIFLDGTNTRVKLFATNTFFGWNKATSVYSRVYYGCSLPCTSRASFTNCTFYANQGPVIDINESPQSNPWEFEGNLFTNNTQGSVIMTTKDTDYRYTPEVIVRKNKFLFNFCQDESVISIKGGTKDLIIEGNVFEENYGRSVYIEQTSISGVGIKSNVFRDNRCSNRGVIEVRRMEEDIIIVGNVFKSNQGLFMVLLHCEYVLHGQGSTLKKKVTFTNNSLVNNSEVSFSSPPCEVSISGLTYYKMISFKYNRFNSSSFSKELCVNTLASSHYSALDASLNYWGHDNEVKIKKRIFDAEDNYEKTSAAFRPFVISTGTVIKGSHKNVTFNALLKGILGGRISSKVVLSSDHNPYIVMSDVTVLPEASLEISPGVEVQFMPGVGMFVLGSLFVRGAIDHPVTFSLFKKNQNENSIPVRLIGGKFPWKGRVEILHNGNWTPVCVNETVLFGTNNAKVVCEQLGYKVSLSNSHSLQESASEWMTCAVLRCNGSEVDLRQCPLSFHNLSCNSSRQVLLNCDRGIPWGNIKFLREAGNMSRKSTSNLQYLRMEHCGKKHGQDVSAIEMIQYVPVVNYVTVLNCTAGGVKVWFPEKKVLLTNSSFVNTGGNGVEIIITRLNVTLESVSSIRNKYGLSFHEPDGVWINDISYGQVNLCATQTVVNITDHVVFLHFRAPFMTYSNPQVSCHMYVQTEEDSGLAVQLLVIKNTKSVQIQLPNGNRILTSYGSNLGPLSRRRVIAWNAFTVYLEGWYSSEVLLQVQRVDNKG